MFRFLVQEHLLDSFKAGVSFVFRRIFVAFLFREDIRTRISPIQDFPYNLEYPVYFQLAIRRSPATN